MPLTILEALDQLDKKQTDRVAKLKIELDMKQKELKTWFDTEMKKKIAHLKAQFATEVEHEKKAATTLKTQ
jgi:hypothetical protein